MSSMESQSYVDFFASQLGLIADWQTAHLYEYTTQCKSPLIALMRAAADASVWISKDNKIRGNEPQAVPVQMIFCMKEKNQKKVSIIFLSECPKLTSADQQS